MAFTDIISNNKGVVAWILIIVLLTSYKLYKCLSTESFDGYYKKYCPSCSWRSRDSCSSCTNCGYCVTANGYGECVAGDSSGPYFREDCAYWEYGDPYYNYPDGQAYPVMKVDDVYPFQRWNLRKGRWGWSKQEVGDRLRRQARANRELRARLKESQM